MSIKEPCHKFLSWKRHGAKHRDTTADCVSIDFLYQELQDAEFIPMPEDSRGSMPGPLTPSYSESVTLPYEELQELKAAAAAAAATEKGLSVIISQHINLTRLFIAWGLQMTLSLPILI